MGSNDRVKSYRVDWSSEQKVILIGYNMVKMKPCQLVRIGYRKYYNYILTLRGR